MLPAANRMRRSADFTAIVANGRRVRNGAIVVHQGGMAGSAGDGLAPKVGLVVGRPVGGSVVRHRVSRRLRAQLAARVGRLTPGTGLVVRALPASAQAASTELGADLDSALRRLGRPAR